MRSGSVVTGNMKRWDNTTWKISPRGCIPSPSGRSPRMPPATGRTRTDPARSSPPTEGAEGARRKGRGKPRSIRAGAPPRSVGVDHDVHCFFEVVEYQHFFWKQEIKFGHAQPIGILVRNRLEETDRVVRRVSTAPPEKGRTEASILASFRIRRRVWRGFPVTPMRFVSVKPEFNPVFPLLVNTA